MLLLLLFVSIALWAGGCSTYRREVPPPPLPTPPVQKRPSLRQLGYVIQAGAFSQVERAIRLTGILQKKGLDAYYFRHEASGTYKVRFGDYPSHDSALAAATDLQRAGVIEEFYVVSPEKAGEGLWTSEDRLREGIIETARSFIGVPYRWGGDSRSSGFDCSGFASAVYHLNGLDLPRSSREQWDAGTPVQPNDLTRGDLVFFATSRRGRVSHVGVYIGDGRFIHAPRTGKKIRIDSLSSDYFSHRFLGGMTYL